jgi:hypothetical protein
MDSKGSLPGEAKWCRMTATRARTASKGDETKQQRQKCCKNVANKCCKNFAKMLQKCCFFFAKMLLFFLQKFCNFFA